MTVTHATEADLLDVSSWLANATDCLLWAGPRVSFPLKTVQLVHEIMFCEDNSYCYTTAAGLAGFGQLININDTCYHLARIITNPDCRGRGIARQLCLQLVKLAWQRGASQLSLNVYRNNVQALSLYQSLGFIEQTDRSDSETVYMLLTNQNNMMTRTDKYVQL